MVKSTETGPNAHPFWYAQVLGIYHAVVSVIPMNDTSAPTRLPSISGKSVEFLWVRWYGVEQGYRSGFQRARLPKIGFVPDSDEFAFGFLDPSYVLRGCHLMPDFASGKTDSLLQSPSGRSLARRVGEEEDWTNFYVGM